MDGICTFGPTLKALLQDKMSHRSQESLPYNIDHKLLNKAPTGKYDLSMDLSDSGSEILRGSAEFRVFRGFSVIFGISVNLLRNLSCHMGGGGVTSG